MCIRVKHENIGITGKRKVNLKLLLGPKTGIYEIIDLDSDTSEPSIIHP